MITKGSRILSTDLTFASTKVPARGEETFRG